MAIKKKGAGTQSVTTLRRSTTASQKPLYSTKFYKGDYIDRQRQANTDKCVAYVEHHFNSSDNPNPNYAIVISGANASQTSRNWGRWYAAAAREFDLSVGGDRSIQVGGYNGRGDANLRYTKMPAVLLEPLFASNPRHAEIIRSDAGQSQLALILCEHRAQVQDQRTEGSRRGDCRRWLGGGFCRGGAAEDQGPCRAGPCAAGRTCCSHRQRRPGIVALSGGRRCRSALGPGAQGVADSLKEALNKSTCRHAGAVP